jgi:hypothetical protein
MTASLASPLDLTPPRFVEGLADWSRGDGAPDAPSFEGWAAARIVEGDADFGDCLELALSARAERMRYMGELPLRSGAAVELRLRLKAVRGPVSRCPVPRVRIAARPGAAGARALPDLPAAGPLVPLPADGAPVELRLVLARAPGPHVDPRVDLVWDARALYAHVGLDLLGQPGGRVRIADLAAREIVPPSMPGFPPHFRQSNQITPLNSYHAR